MDNVQYLTNAAVSAYQVCGSLNDAITLAAQDRDITLTPQIIADALMRAHEIIRPTISVIECSR